MSNYHPGDSVRLSAAFTDDEGEAADPTAVTLRVRASGEEAADYVYGTDEELVRDGEGAFHLEYLVPDLAPAFRVWYRFVGAGAVEAADEDSFLVTTEWYGISA